MLHLKKIETHELYVQFSVDVFNYALSLLKDTEKASDALQDVFLKFIETEKNFKGDCSYKTWLLVITRNYCFNKLLKNKKSNLRLEDIDELSDTIKIDDKLSIEDAINKLSQDESEIIYLREYAGHSYKEMAEILETTVDNVKVKLFRVRKKLRKYLR